MDSDSDLSVIQKDKKILEAFNVAFEKKVISFILDNKGIFYKVLEGSGNRETIIPNYFKNKKGDTTMYPHDKLFYR